MNPEVEKLTLSVVKFLETKDAVKKVEYTHRPPSTSKAIEIWESKNSPYKLPNDFKSFLLVSDGILIQWTAEVMKEAVPMGCIHLNPLFKLNRIALKKFLLHGDDTSSDEEDEVQSSSESSNDSKFAAFDIDSTCKGGRLAFFYQGGSHEDPQVWFQGLSCKWYFIADSFTNYFRLLIMHCGVPFWYYAYTDIGLDPITEQWLRLLVPERLGIDIVGMNKKNQATKEPKSRYEFDGNPDKEWAIPRAVVKINLKKLEKYARQLKSKRKSRSRRGDEEPSGSRGGERKQFGSSFR